MGNDNHTNYGIDTKRKQKIDYGGRERYIKRDREREGRVHIYKTQSKHKEKWDGEREGERERERERESKRQREGRKGTHIRNTKKKKTLSLTSYRRHGRMGPLQGIPMGFHFYLRSLTRLMLLERDAIYHL